MFWAPWTLLSLEAAQVVAFLVLGIGSLTAFSVILLRIGYRIIPASDDRHPVALIVALVLAARLILRDLTESGPIKRKWRTATVALATAAVLSVSPGLLRPSPLFWQEMRSWMGNAWQGVTAVDPSETILDKPAIGNLFHCGRRWRGSSSAIRRDILCPLSTPGSFSSSICHRM